MELKGKHVDLTVTELFCTSAKIEREVRYLKEAGAVLHPISSESVQSMDSRFEDTGEFMDRITAITETKPILKTEEVEPIGPEGYLDILLIAPCTGNTLAKLASGITDTSVLMVARAHLRNGRPLMVSVSTNDALSINLKNVGLLFNMKSVYFIPFGRDDPMKESTSMITHAGLMGSTLKEALEGRQIQSIIQRV